MFEIYLYRLKIYFYKFLNNFIGYQIMICNILMIKIVYIAVQLYTILTIQDR